MKAAHIKLVQEISNDSGEGGDDEDEEDEEERIEKKQMERGKESQSKRVDSFPLDLNLSEGSLNTGGEASSEIMFSPGGNEAYVFTQASPEHHNPQDRTYHPSKIGRTPKSHKDEHVKTIQEDTALADGNLSAMLSGQTRPEKEVGTPREIFDEIFIERSKDAAPLHPRGERPTTVGQSADSPNKVTQQKIKGRNIHKNVPPMSNRSPRLSPRKTGKGDQIQERLEDYKSSLFAAQISTTEDTDNVYSTEHSADPSPRRLPALPYSLTRDQYLQHPDNLTVQRDITATVSERDEGEIAYTVCFRYSFH